MALWVTQTFRPGVTTKYEEAILTEPAVGYISVNFRCYVVSF